MAKTEMIHPKNVGAQVAMVFKQNEYSAIEKIEILGAILELPAKQHCQFGQSGQSGQSGPILW